MPRRPNAAPDGRSALPQEGTSRLLDRRWKVLPP